MVIFRSGVRLLLLTFASAIQAALPDPNADFCSLSIHMSEGASFRHLPPSCIVSNTY